MTCCARKRNNRFPRMRGILLLVAAGLLAMDVARGAAPPDGNPAMAGERVPGPVPTGWAEAEGLRTMAGDSLDLQARIFDSPDYQMELLVPGEGATVFVLDLTAKSVRTLPRKDLVWSGGRPTPDLTGTADAGLLAIQDGVIAFTLGGVSWKIQPEPPVVGPVTLEQLMQAKPEYGIIASRYRPDPAAIRALRTLTVKTEIVIFFGTWCNYCKRWLPRFLATLEAAANANIDAEFIGVSETGGEPKAALAQYKVTETPTFIVLQGGQQIGRIENEPSAASIEEDLVRILGLR